MISIIIYGHKYVGRPVSEGIKKELFCKKCKKNRLFVEMKGIRYFHIYFIPFFPTSKKVKYMECTSCESVIFDYKRIIEENEEIEKKDNLFKKEVLKIIKEIESINVKCPSCKKDGKVRIPEGDFSVEAICQTCGNIYEVKKPK
ncbi:MAG: zinc-ribbon domain-containing protein [Candidatus Nomurabacteria bacterium]|nr:zinc-ribbon domain-containing protein [Candidatus Nomurabacteria bacterium]